MTSLLAALRRQDAPLNILSIIRDPATNLEETDETLTTPLMLATYMGQYPFVHELLLKGVSPNKVDKNGETALHIAAYNNRVEIVKCLLKLSDMNIGLENVRGKTALQLATEMEHKDVMLAFYDAAKATTAQPAKETAGTKCLKLIDAIKHRQLAEFAERTKDLTAAVANLTDADGWTPLMWACACGEKDMVATLLKVPKIDIMKTNKKRESAYTVADGSQRYAIKRMLHDTAYDRISDLQVFQDSIEQELCYGISRGCDSDVAKILSIPGLNINDPDETYRSLGGKATALSQAAYQGSDDVVEKLLNYPGIKVNVRSRIGRTPLMLAMETLCRGSDYHRVVELLLAHPDTDLNAKDDYGDTALKIAVKENATELADLLRKALKTPRPKRNSEWDSDSD
jgi:ankyrin repeat protein